MAKKRRNRKNGRNRSTVSVAGFLYLLKYMGQPFLKHGGKGQPIVEFQRNGIGAASQAVWSNIENYDITMPVIDGLKIGLVRRIGLGSTIMTFGKTRIRSV